MSNICLMPQSKFLVVKLGSGYFMPLFWNVQIICNGMLSSTSTGHPD